jgi:hypothetical protein
MSEELQRDEILSAGPDDGDWVDVIRRASQARRRQGIYGAALLTALVVVGVASAYALGHPIVDFNTAEKGSTKVVNDFGSMEVGAPENMAPGVLPEQARRIPGLYVDGKSYNLWVAPTKQGGFCTTEGCIADRRTLAGHIGVSTSGNKTGTGVSQISGEFIEDGGERLELTYADGSHSDVPFVWVTAPIDAGFFVFGIPEEHQVPAERPVTITLFDKEGKVLSRGSVMDMSHFRDDIASVTHDIPGYPHLSVPAKAIWSQSKQLFDLRADDGARVGLWVAPKRGGGTCVWTTQSAGCSDPGQVEERPALALGFEGGGSHVNLGDRVGANVARVEARFEDGDKVELLPKEGYLIWPIPSRHYSLGHRLEELVAFDAGGQVIARQSVSTTERGLYPCETPKDYGYGVRMCP